jgi:hypothetical protein
MSLPLFQQSPLQQAFTSLRSDLLHEDGPRISTMRNYRFAILQYEPSEEFKLRTEVQRLTSDLVAGGWVVLSISLQALLMERIRSQGPRWTEQLIQMERALPTHPHDRGLNFLKTKIPPLIEGPDGIAADCARIIRAHLAAHPDFADRTLAVIGRAGALYPFFRSSALLRHLDGHTHQVPVVLLYPGKRLGQTGLSFMGVVHADNDYRPRIYP